MERAAEPYHKAMDDAAARLSRFFLIAGGTSFSGLMAFMATFSVFRGADSLVDLLFAIVLAMVSTAMLIGCTAWAVILLTGAMNALILASEEEPPARPPYLLRWAFWLVGKGKPKIWMTFFAFALSAIIVFALVTAWPVFIAMVDDWLAALL